MPQVVGDAIQLPERRVALGIDAEFDRGFACRFAVARVSPRNLQVLALDSCRLQGRLHKERPVHALPEVGDIESVDAVPLDHRRGGNEHEPLFPRVEDCQNREAYDQYAAQEEPGAGLQECQNADDGPCDSGQGGQGLKREWHGEGREPARSGAGSALRLTFT